MKRIVFILVTTILIIRGYSQESISVSGGNGTGSGGSVCYSVGQVFYNTITKTNGSVAEGVQQPYEISVVMSIEEPCDINVILSIYPNPTSKILTLKVENYDLKNLSYRLYDINGKLLESKIISGTDTYFNMTNYITGTYFLKVLKNKKEVKTFKIIKN